MLAGGPILGKKRSEPSLLNSIIAFSIFGVPAAYWRSKGVIPGGDGMHLPSILPSLDTVKQRVTILAVIHESPEKQASAHG